MRRLTLTNDQADRLIEAWGWRPMAAGSEFLRERAQALVDRTLDILEDTIEIKK